MKRFGTLAVFFVLCLSTGDAQSNQYLWQVQNNARGIMLLHNHSPLLCIDSIQFNFVTNTNATIKEQSAKRVIIDLLYQRVPSFREVNKSIDDTVTLTIEHIDGGWHITAAPAWARHVTLFLRDQGEQYYGILENLVPYNRKEPGLRGTTQIFEVQGEESRYFENYSSVWSAFYFTNRGYASFFNTFAYGEYKFALHGTTEIYHRTGKLDWYIFVGNDGDEIMRSYFTIIGAPKYVPAWACGPIVWRDEAKKGKADILSDAEKFTDLRIPLSAMFVDRPYSDGNHGWSKMNFNALFSEPEQWISTLRNHYNLEFMTWIGPAVFGDTFPGVLPGFYNYFDLTNPQCTAEFARRLNTLQYAYGVKGHKMDRADEHFPVSEPWNDKTPFWERRNKYIYLYAKVTDSILSAYWGKDNFNFARAAMHGTQPYLSAVWGGDVRASWDGMAANLANAMRCSFLGFPNWGGDVGGYLGETGFIPEQLYRRWLQWGTWCGMFEIKIDGPGGRGTDRAPWRYGESLQKSFRKACEERMELAPYIYSLLNTSSENGVLMKPLVYVYPNDTITCLMWDEYLFGNAFLVAPLLSEKNSRRIYLPDGVWYDWYSPQQKFSGKQYIMYEAPNDHIPVFVKEGSLFITGRQWLRGNWRLWNTDTIPQLLIHIFPSYQTQSSASFKYVDFYDNDAHKIFLANYSDKKLEVVIPRLSSDSYLFVYGNKRILSSTLNGTSISSNNERTRNAVIFFFQKGTEGKLTLLYEQ